MLIGQVHFGESMPLLSFPSPFFFVYQDKDLFPVSSLFSDCLVSSLSPLHQTDVMNE